ncbi:DeoR/GlpR family DNA-binding transcription regulator [Actinacidiphila alni]|uniref:DeoR/GlpR family DNA-binding transcription regulator n=1 Tax=Actinacidiphila alni TaxID=380248 RepID=UPI000B81B277|nr:DeoR/GlpR family DNA-binding transcription regulator [Actinacidiphila alni]
MTPKADDRAAEEARPAFPTERRRALVELLRERRRLTVVEISERFQVTPETVRRDLVELEQTGALRRVHGGAILLDNEHGIPGLAQRTRIMAEEKTAIATAALEHMPTSGAVLIDAGSTTGRLADLYPGGPQLVVMTNSLPIAITMAGKPGAAVYTTGGRVRNDTLAEVEMLTLRALDEVKVDVAFVATSGITVDHGFSTSDVSESAVKRTMMASATRVVVLCDHSKIGTALFSRFARIDAPDLLITDSGIGAAQLAELRGAGLDVQVAEPV